MPRRLDERRHDAAIESGAPTLAVHWAWLLVACGVRDEEHRRPWGHDEGDEQREEHSRRSANWDGSHVRSHETADEGHGQDRSDDRDGRQDGRIADLGDGFDGDFARWTVMVLG